MNRLIPPDLQDLSLWPTVDPNALASERRGALLNRIEAVRLYAAGTPLSEIEKRTSVPRMQISRLIKRCIQPHRDGRIRGFRALIPFARSKMYQRTADVRPTTRTRRSGSSGAMTALLERHENLSLLLRQKLSSRAVFFGARGQLCGLHDVHHDFLNACRLLGLTAKDYPLSQDRQGIRSLAKALRKFATTTFADGARNAGAERISPPWSSKAKDAMTIARKPFDIVEFDGHKIDIRLHVRFEDGAGVIEHIHINRVWLLVIIDVFSRAILGWNVVLSAEYNRHDVIRTIQQALMPQRKRAQLLIPGLTYSISGGFVGEVAPFLDGACWEHLRFDNAKANLASDTLALLSTVVGCVTEAGPVGEPTERPYVERFFGTLESTLFHRLQGTTGSHPRDVRRRLMNPKGKESLPISFDELLELTEVCIANYNGTPHDGIGDRTPLEFLTQAIEFHRDTLRVLSEPFRRQLCILQPSELRTVMGSLQRGVRPYINLYGVRYSSRLLQQATDLLGKSIRIYMDPQDLTVVQAYLPDGAEFGPLNAARPWHRTKHSLRLRQEIQRLRRARKLHFTEGDDPVQIYLSYKRKETAKRAARNPYRTAEASRALSPSLSSVTPSTDTPAAPDLVPIVLPVAKPRPLRLIGTGQVTKVRTS
jgi:transposase InsO family protein